MKPKHMDRPVVLLVDDEKFVSNLLRRMLEPEGYVVLDVNDPKAACRMAEEQDRIDLLISDYRMPDMTGGEVARRIRIAKPHIRVLFITGYADALFEERTSLWEGEAFLEKPFSRTALLQAASLLLFGRLDRERTVSREPENVLRDPRSWGFDQTPLQPGGSTKASEPDACMP